jgi:hypothetical protein
MVSAVEKVRERLRRVSQVLEAAGIPYAIVGGNAVAAWVSEVDEAAVRNTRDVDILVCRDDFERIKAAMASAGFLYRHAKSIDMFLDGEGAKARDAVHVIFAGEKIKQDDPIAAPDVSESKATATSRVLALEPLVRMKLTSFRDKDRTHLRDLLEVGLIDTTWVGHLPAELGARLQQILDTPEG